MKILYLLRHAKALTGEGGDDRARALAPRGLDAARMIGEYARAHPPHPSHALCSPATRTRQTLEIFTAALGTPLEASYPERLYLAMLGELFVQVQALPERAETALVVGHNPGIHQLCLLLAGDAAPHVREDAALHFPTASFATLRLPIRAWKELKPGCGMLVAFTYPKALNA